MKLGANSLLFGAWDMETAFKYLAMAGYDGIEMSAIDSMSQHLVLSRWQECAPEIKRLSKEYDLELLAMEQSSRDPDLMELAFQAAVETGIPIICCGPGGKADDESTYQQVLDELGALVHKAEKYGVTLCAKGTCRPIRLQHADQPQSIERYHLTVVRLGHGSLAYLPRRRESGRSDRSGDLAHQACAYPRLQGTSAGTGRARRSSQRAR